MCYSVVTRVLQGCYRGVTRVLYVCFMGITVKEVFSKLVLFSWYFSGSYHYLGTFLVFMGIFGYFCLLFHYFTYLCLLLMFWHACSCFGTL